jgi:hypothetical protein
VITIASVAIPDAAPRTVQRARQDLEGFRYLDLFRPVAVILGLLGLIA